MTEVPTYDADSETRAEFIAKIAKAYDVPMTLIRYNTIEQTEQDND